MAGLAYDLPEYGKLIVYEFPKEKLVYGPFQIEALINQNTDISQQISLWNQMGSRVIRGTLLVVADRELDPVRVAAVSPRTVWPVAGTQARDSGLHGDRVSDGGDTPGGSGRIVQGINPGRGLACAPSGLRRRAPRMNEPSRRSRNMIGHFPGFKGRGLEQILPNSTLYCHLLRS